MNVRIKRAAGGIILDPERRLFLGSSPKWNKLIVPGGEVKQPETDEEAFIREIQEELSLQVEILKKLGESTKEPSKDFKDEGIRFHFIDFLARVSSKELVKLKTNHEFSSHGWYTVEAALTLDLLDSTQKLIESSIDDINSAILLP